MNSAGLKYYKIENATTINVCFWCDKCKIMHTVKLMNY